MMDNEKQSNPNNQTGNPEKTYHDEMHDKGGTISDTNEESDARDKAKMHKSLNGHGQKMDSIHPDELGDGKMEELIERERKEKM